MLHIIPSDGLGGVETAARTMAARENLDCDFALLLIAGGPVERLPRIIEGAYRSINDPRAHAWALRTILKQSPDVLICSLWRSVPAALLARLLRPRMKLAFFLHAEIPVHPVDNLMARLGAVGADAIWADSPATLQCRYSPPRTPTKHISFVVERLRPRRVDAVRPRFVSWGRLAHQKGIDRALPFIAQLVEGGIDASFDVWGPDGGEEAALRALTASLGLKQRVRFLGPLQRSRLAEVAAEASFFLQLSRFEGMGMAVVEAMQLGLVPVVTQVGQIARYCSDGKTGVVVDTEDMAPAVAKVASLIKCQSHFERISYGARRFWADAPLYADDVCAAAVELACGIDPTQPGHVAKPRLAL